MRRTLASPILAISSNNPSAIFADALSASIRTARRGERSSEGMMIPSQEAVDSPTSRLSPPDLNGLTGARLKARRRWTSAQEGQSRWRGQGPWLALLCQAGYFHVTEPRKGGGRMTFFRHYRKRGPVNALQMRL